MTDKTMEVRPEPSKTAIREITSGIEIESLGSIWKLADVGLAKALNHQRNSLYDDLVTCGDMSLGDIKYCVWIMLSINYRLTGDQGIAIIEGFDKEEMVEAVTKSVLVHSSEQSKNNYTNWARSCLLANGIDPAKMERSDLPHVLRQLVATERAIALEDFTAAAAHAALKTELLTAI